MTSSHPHPNPPTSKQLRFLRDLAVSRGRTFVVPTTAAEASVQIDQLKKRRRSSHADRAAERFTARQVSETRGPATEVRADEVEGYGASARWKR
jgi:hypothetical protein